MKMNNEQREHLTNAIFSLDSVIENLATIATDDREENLQVSELFDQAINCVIQAYEYTNQIKALMNSEILE